LSPGLGGKVVKVKLNSFYLDKLRKLFLP